MHEECLFGGLPQATADLAHALRATIVDTDAVAARITSALALADGAMARTRHTLTQAELELLDPWRSSSDKDENSGKASSVTARRLLHTRRPRLPRGTTPKETMVSAKPYVTDANITSSNSDKLGKENYG